MSYEPGTYSADENGFFTGAILKSLQSLESDADGDGSVSIDEMKRWVTGAVSERSGGLQNPTVDRDNLSVRFGFPLESAVLSRAGESERRTYLISAISHGSSDRITALLGPESGLADPAVVEAFIDAAARGDGETVKALLAAGLDPLAADRQGRTALREALTRFRYPVVYELIEAGTSIPAVMLVDARERGLIDRIAGRIEEGAPVELEDAPMALLDAARKDYPQVVRILVEAGTNVNAGYEDPALVTAIKRGHAEIALMLIEAGADIEADDWRSDAPLTAAAAGGLLEVVKRLLEHGADVRTRNRDGKTAADLAAEQGHRDVTRLLEEAAR